MALLEVQDIQVYYGMIQALKGVSFSVNEGEVIALIGANGAGKTTTLHTVTGLLRAKSGHIIYDGQDITKVPPHKIVTMGMAHVPEGRRVFANMIKEVSESGTTVLLVEQNAKKALSIADRAYVLETGRITLEGKASDLLHDESVQKAYLGE